MHLIIPHGYQPNDYTCGPKTLWMVLCYYKKRLPLSILQRLCQTNMKTGTTRKMMKRAMRHLGFTVHSKCDSSLKDVETWIKKGIPVIVNFREPDEGDSHFAVVIGITRTNVVLHDPWHGPHTNISRREFVKRWYGKHHTKFTRWMMVAQPEKDMCKARKSDIRT